MSCPSPIHVRRTVEKYILQLFEADGVTLKPYTSWPGYYTLPNATRLPAVYLVGAQQVPSNWVVTGIETTIQDVPSPRDLGGVGCTITAEDWTVQFINYGSAKGTSMPVSLLDIQRLVTRTFPGDPVSYSPRNEVSFETLTVQIRSAVLNAPIP